MSEEADLLSGKFSTVSFIDKTPVSRTGTILRVEEHGVLFREHGYRRTAESREFFLRNEDIVSIQQASDKEIAEVLAREAEGSKKPTNRRVRKRPPKPPPAAESPNKGKTVQSEPELDETEEEDISPLLEEEFNNDDDFDDEDDWED